MGDTKETRWGIYTGFKIYLLRIIFYALQDCYYFNFKYRCRYGINDDEDDDPDSADESRNKPALSTKAAWEVLMVIIWLVYFISYCYFFLLVKNFGIRPMGK